jgi:hypothetical protein
MKQEDIDRILSGKQEIVPSSGFLDSVMDAVRREAVAPPPIAFPWRRAAPGLAVAFLAIVWVLVATIVLFTHASAGQSLPFAFVIILQAAKTVRAGWIAMALVTSFASVKLSNRLAVRSI